MNDRSFTIVTFYEWHYVDLIVTFFMNDRSFTIVTFHEWHYVDLIVTFL